jgi:bacterioferritin
MVNCGRLSSPRCPTSNIAPEAVADCDKSAELPILSAPHGRRQAAHCLHFSAPAIQRKPLEEELSMATATTKTKETAPAQHNGEPGVSRRQLIDLLNDDLAREYQAIIAYVVYSQVMKGAAYMSIAEELEKHAGEELDHALSIAKQIDYLGGMPTVSMKPVRLSEKAEDMLRFDLDNENETIRNYRQRVRQCEAIGEFAMAEEIRRILVQEQEHQIDLATALGIDVPHDTI